MAIKRGTTMNNNEYFFPHPVLRDRKKEYRGQAVNLYDWAGKIREEVAEAEVEIKAGDMMKLAVELQDIINVCTSFEAWLGYDFKRSQGICKAVNEKNEARGYVDDK